MLKILSDCRIYAHTTFSLTQIGIMQRYLNHSYLQMNPAELKSSSFAIFMLFILHSPGQLLKAEFDAHNALNVIQTAFYFIQH
jgi:hypothetical protein